MLYREIIVFFSDPQKTHKHTVCAECTVQLLIVELVLQWAVEL